MHSTIRPTNSLLQTSDVTGWHWKTSSAVHICQTDELTQLTPMRTSARPYVPTPHKTTQCPSSEYRRLILLTSGSPTPSSFKLKLHHSPQCSIWCGFVVQQIDKLLMCLWLYNFSTLWNSLQLSHPTLTLASFCSRLKTHLFTMAYGRALVTA